mmetsp:Transcript_12745/g.40293  ORF Transcript_12745/g.40293 Transcript_12745/m.40293 type:complete len:203 (+) Transcript_12745:1109-1717(+)
MARWRRPRGARGPRARECTPRPCARGCSRRAATAGRTEWKTPACSRPNSGGCPTRTCLACSTATAARRLRTSPKRTWRRTWARTGPPPRWRRCWAAPLWGWTRPSGGAWRRNTKPRWRGWAGPRGRPSTPAARPWPRWCTATAWRSPTRGTAARCCAAAASPWLSAATTTPRARTSARASRRRGGWWSGRWTAGASGPSVCR